MWSRLWHLPIALKLSILGLLSAVVTLVITQYELPPSTPLTISFSPNLVEFRSTALHVPAMTQSVTVTNRAETSLTLGPVTIAGPAQEDFFISENSCQEKTLPAGGDCRISVIFTPSVDGPRVAEVLFHDAARRESAQLSLQGSTGPPPKTELGQMLLTPNPFDFGGAGNRLGNHCFAHCDQFRFSAVARRGNRHQRRPSPGLFRWRKRLPAETAGSAHELRDPDYVHSEWRGCQNRHINGRRRKWQQRPSNPERDWHGGDSALSSLTRRRPSSSLAYSRQ